MLGRQILKALALAAAATLGVLLMWSAATRPNGALLQREREQHRSATRVLLRRVRTKFAAQEKRIHELEHELRIQSAAAAAAAAAAAPTTTKTSTSVDLAMAAPAPGPPLQAGGNARYGGWTFDTTGITAASVVYSVGVGEDASWDKHMISTFGCKVFAFDPTPKASRYVKQDAILSSSPLFVFVPEGLGVSQSKQPFTLPANPDHVSMRALNLGAPTRSEIRGAVIHVQINTLRNWMAANQHERIDILKIDVEGGEFAVIQDWAEKGDTRFFDQLLVEFHHRFFRESEKLLAQAINVLEEAGFEVFHRAENEYGFRRIK
jgi:FkbM family methyltransferase